MRLGPFDAAEAVAQGEDEYERGKRFAAFLQFLRARER